MSTRLLSPPVLEFELPPTEDELLYDDGMPMATLRHRLQMNLLIEPIELAWADRDDFFISGNMFVYFSPNQVMDYDFRGPDFFAVLGVPKRERKSWVIWQEGKGPDVIIELLSESTARQDKSEKKQIYQNRLRVPEYYWYDPFTAEWAGFTLQKGVYQPIRPDKAGRLISSQMNLALVHWDGVYGDVEARWLRWATLDGVLLPTGREWAEQERERAEQERERAEQERIRAEQAEAEAAALGQMLARYQAQFGDLPDNI